MGVKIRYILSVFIIALGSCNLTIAYDRYKDYCLANLDGLYLFVNPSVFPEMEFIVSLFLILYGFILIKKSLIMFKALLIYSLIMPLCYFSYIISYALYHFRLVVDISELIQRLFVFFGMIFLMILISNYYNIDWKNKIKSFGYKKFIVVGILLGLFRVALTIYG